MEGDFPGDTFNIEEEGRGKADYSFAINGVVGIPCIDRFLQPHGGKGMFLDKPPIKAGDACAAVNEGAGVDGFQGVRWFDKLNWNLHRGSSFYIDHSTLYTREDLRQRSLKIHGGEGNSPHILVFFVIVDGFQLGEVF